MIPIFNPQRNFWVVRADKGKLFQKFLEEDFVGIAHVDNLPIRKEKIDSEFRNDLAEQNFINKIGRNKIVQIRAFIEKISIDDWVITLNHKHICIGRIVEDAKLINDEDPIYKNKINLRRKVVWGPRVSRLSIPHDLSNSLKTNLTVFNINKCCESIFHTIFPYFIKDNKLHTTIIINTESKIKTNQIAQLFETIATVESISTRAINSLISAPDTVIISTVKAEFSSPGGVRVQYKSLEFTIPFPKWIPITLLSYTLIFGNDLSGFQGLIPAESRKEIISFILNLIKEKEIDNLKKDLDISIPKIEDSSKLLSEKEKIPFHISDENNHI